MRRSEDEALAAEADAYQADADAARQRLMNAAPDLLAACKAALDGKYRYGTMLEADSVRYVLKAAIEKAEGRRIK